MRASLSVRLWSPPYFSTNPPPLPPNPIDAHRSLPSPSTPTVPPPPHPSPPGHCPLPQLFALPGSPPKGFRSSDYHEDVLIFVRFFLPCMDLGGSWFATVVIVVSSVSKWTPLTRRPTHRTRKNSISLSISPFLSFFFPWFSSGSSAQRDGSPI